MATRQASAPVIFLTTVSSKKTARALAKTLLLKKYAACINVVGATKSFYFWKGALREENEFLIIGKTSKKRFGSLKKNIKTLHPYQLPELISFSVEDGLPEYLAWICASL